VFLRRYDASGQALGPVIDGPGNSECCARRINGLVAGDGTGRLVAAWVSSAFQQAAQLRGQRYGPASPPLN
jgi:hypothetical protein